MSADRQSLWATGKRKTSVARVRLRPGEGEIAVNARPLDVYFGRETSRMIVNQPFEVTSTQNQYRVDVLVQGGGVSAQAVAIRHGITRALLQVDPELRSPLKKAGFITRDPREVELPDVGPIFMEDAETGEQLYIDTHDKKFRQRFLAAAQEREAALSEAFKRSGVDALPLSTEEDLVRAIVRFAGLRKQRRR